MNEANSLVRRSFDDDPMPADARERLWTTMETRLSRQAQLRNLIRGGILLLAAAIVAAAFLIRNAVRSAAGGSGAASTFAIAADSISNDSPVELAMQESQQTSPEVPQSLIPLLGHRSSLRMDLVNFEARREQLTKQLNQTAGSEHDRIAAQIIDIERQMESTQLAIETIDRQLAGVRHEPVHAPGDPAIAVMAPPQVIELGGGVPNQLTWIAGSAGILLALGMAAMLVYMRKLARATRNALGAIEGQVSSQHATLAAGIDAIALEVERLGEGQRFMSKALADKVASKS